MIYLVDNQHDVTQQAYTFFALNMASSADYEHARLAKIICLTEVTSPGLRGKPLRRPDLRRTAVVRSVTLDGDHDFAGTIRRRDV